MSRSGPGRRRALWSAGAVAVLGCLVGGLVAVLPGSHTHDGAASAVRRTGVEVSAGHCGRGWDAPASGLQVFALHNTTGAAAEVFLEDPHSHAVFGEVEDIGPGTTRELTVRLGKGAYAFTCVPEDTDAVTGPTVRIRTGRSGPAAAPVTEHDLIPPALAYQKWVAAGLDKVVRLTGTLRGAVDRGDLGAARAAWLPAHLQYERMGAAYDAFGDADGAINGIDAGLPDGVHDKDFTGFHRVEYGLWHHQSARRLRSPAGALLKAVTALRDSWAQARMDPAQLGLRAHEILENTVQFELTGRTDYGSGSNLATARANIDGTREVLSRLRPLLTSRYPELTDLEQALGSAGQLLDGLRHHGRWTPVGSLGRARREHVDAAFGDLVERLASVAALCDPRRTV
ncbi:EfeM/EfeO family lipoprotein [Streptomyces sp. VRA16 Mangrove soil]|uniref:EfeM/EfeO family lipoprotein n=1 Tax=Streptomyces sp. VRA16 Mangrove soil TaxID=2817434 RepID=UPI001A9E8D10|nr:EfeM/EfeO family lipoprotein [Streptomyces sp. VRA16 Mangrove soil]MBO1332786.1 EfeM/EfeO family lipoprotein [Streptomyces sp. VRA16 Mangrove soil]